jgi:hypothetical protein
MLLDQHMKIAKYENIVTLGILFEKFYTKTLNRATSEFGYS